MKSLAIDIQNLSFSYGNTGRTILDIPQFSVERGEKIFLFGSSGGGKTTLLELLAGVLVPSKGEILVLGQPLGSLTASQRDHFRASQMGYIFQNFNLIPYLNVFENITLPLHLSPARKARLTQEEEAVKFLTSQLGIQNLLDRRVTELSIGQQQRVAAARALLGNPDLILADEPTSSLDYDHREKFIKLLFEVCQSRNITLLFVSHDRSLQKLFDRSISLSEINQATARATTEELR